jgi:dolichol-phosphate mannosyltransferase
VSGASADPRVWLVLPAYDEAKNIPSLFAAVAEAADRVPGGLTVVLVDDGSTDGTAEVARSAGAALDLRLLENEVNRGLGATFARGMTAAAEWADPEDVIVSMDADDSHLPAQIPEMLAALAAGKDVVVASRYRRGARVHGVSWHRRGLSLGMSMLFRAVCPVRGVRDYSCGYRAYRAGLIQAALACDGEGLFDTTGFGCLVALLLRLDAHGARCVEVPVVLRYDRKRGPSKMAVLPTVAHTLSVLVRARARKAAR